jgi:hypothetical protein
MKGGLLKAYNGIYTTDYSMDFALFLNLFWTDFLEGWTASPPASGMAGEQRRVDRATARIWSGERH